MPAHEEKDLWTIQAPAWQPCPVMNRLLDSLTMLSIYGFVADEEKLKVLKRLKKRRDRDDARRREGKR